VASNAVVYPFVRGIALVESVECVEEDAVGLVACLVESVSEEADEDAAFFWREQAQGGGNLQEFVNVRVADCEMSNEEAGDI
jgi:hypothetical protein